MVSLKMILRDDLVTKKEKYINTESNLIAIDAAVVKASYIKNGGTKLVILPRYCDLITLISIDIMKLHQEQFRCTHDLDTAADFITQEFKTVIRASLVDDNKIKLLLNNNLEIITNKCNEDYTDYMINIASEILTNTSVINYTNIELEQFKKSLRHQLNKA